jgi:hypothetical protein
LAAAPYGSRFEQEGLARADTLQMALVTAEVGEKFSAPHLSAFE